MWLHEEPTQHSPIYGSAQMCDFLPLFKKHLKVVTFWLDFLISEVPSGADNKEASFKKLLLYHQEENREVQISKVTISRYNWHVLPMKSAWVHICF